MLELVAFVGLDVVWAVVHDYLHDALPVGVCHCGVPAVETGDALLNGLLDNLNCVTLTEVDNFLQHFQCVFAGRPGRKEETSKMCKN
jgi:hypothetical protein